MTKRQDLLIRQGADWSWSFTHLDTDGSAVDLSSYTARMAVKASLEGQRVAYLSSGSDADGGSISLAADGTVILSMTAKETGDISADLIELSFDAKSRAERFLYYIYDLELVDSSDVVTRVLQGRITYEREVTN